jgi:hypothetical protein
MANGSIKACGSISTSDREEREKRSIEEAVGIFGGQKCQKYNIKKMGKRKNKTFEKKPVCTLIGVQSAH